MKFFCFLLLQLFVTSSYSALNSTRITCLTSKCHSDMNEVKFLHSPIKAKGCIVCHPFVPASQKSTKLSTAHPNVAVNMENNQSEVCLKCHVEWGNNFKAKKYAHSAIAQKGCISCHNPHGSDNPKLLRNKNVSQELCLSCHKKNVNWENGDKKIIHPALNFKNKCLNCHEIHSSHQPNLLKETPSTLCLSCHKEIIQTKDKGSLHTPVKNGECLQCHFPHYSKMEKLLDKTYEPATYVFSTEKSFQLCFKCHSPLQTTNFRNGEKNLHVLHVLSKFNNNERGCATCHDPHGSTQEMQIRNNFSYKNNLLPIIFQKQTNGGNCTTACHGKKDYDRLTPFQNKEGR